MIWLLWKLITLPFRLVFGTISTTFKTVRFVGISRLLAFGAGVGVGMAVAPTSGEQLRARLSDGYASAASAAGDLGETVRYELADSPRTWHLPQPVVTVEGNRVTLTGEVPHETARGDLGRTAGAVVGVAAVDNRVTVSTN
ncbi:YtxH domain-containing protein [Actinospongicola halichondriae]|uniref:YtxH domain-containing protein n=1 Tax=Actinospongicola halichondriae TaxID=3236844 RepID=UPI003D54C1EF